MARIAVAACARLRPRCLQSVMLQLLVYVQVLQPATVRDNHHRFSEYSPDPANGCEGAGDVHVRDQHGHLPNGCMRQYGAS